MKEKIRSLIRDRYSGKISREEFIRAYFGDKEPNEEYCLDLLEKGLADHNAETVEEAVVVVFAAGFNSRLLSMVLAKLLLEDWHQKHEDIASLMKEIRDPSTVDYLYAAAEKRLDYLEYDDTYQFARKCIKALSAIGTDKAIEKLLLLSGAKTSTIARYAKKELNYQGLG